MRPASQPPASSLHEAIEWSKRHPLDDLAATARATAEPDRQSLGGSRMTVEALADELGVHHGDVRVLLVLARPEHGGLHPDGTLLNEYGGAIRDQLDHLCERTVPGYWWPGHDPDAGKGATKMR